MTYGDTWTGSGYMRKRYVRHPWVWLGDDPSEESGLFYQEDDAPDYVNAVRIEACSQAGGPDNLYHIEVGSLYMPADKLDSVLQTVGFSERGHFVQAENGKMQWPFESEFAARFWMAGKPDLGLAYTTVPIAPRRLVVHAFMVYHGLDIHHQHVVRVGPDQMPRHKEDGWNPKPDHILRANASVKKFVRKEFC